MSCQHQVLHFGFLFPEGDAFSVCQTPSWAGGTGDSASLALWLPPARASSWPFGPMSRLRAETLSVLCVLLTELVQGWAQGMRGWV